jgi:hypothetical protein
MSGVLKGLKKYTRADIVYRDLQKINFLAAALLAGQAVVILILANSSSSVVPVATNYLAKDELASQLAGKTVFAPASHTLFDLKLVYLVAAFLAVGALVRWLAADRVRKKYESGLRTRVNKLRWLEHGFSSALILMTIGLLAGVYDIVSLLFVAWSAGLISWLAYRHEVRRQAGERSDWLDFYLILKTGGIICLVLLIYLVGALIWGDGLPAYVYFVYASSLVLFSGFALNTYFTLKEKGRWANYLWDERVYIALSLILSSALAWQIFFGDLFF